MTLFSLGKNLKSKKKKRMKFVKKGVRGTPDIHTYILLLFLYSLTFLNFFYQKMYIMIISNFLNKKIYILR